jgi:hypothetical protein
MSDTIKHYCFPIICFLAVLQETEEDIVKERRISKHIQDKEVKKII